MEHVALLYVIQDRQEDRLSIIDYNREYFRKSSNVTVGNWISHCEDLKLIVVILDPLNRRVKIPKLTVKGAKLLQTLT